LHDTIIPLSTGFPAATAEDWLKLVGKTLKGAGLETLRSFTADGLSIEPLYADGPTDRVASFAPAPRSNDRPWDIRAVVDHPDPAHANAQILEHLSGGAGSVLLLIGDRGGRGLVIGSVDGLARALAGVLTDLAPVALDAGFSGPACADWLGAIAKASPAAPIELHLDPLSAFAVTGASPGPIEAHLIAAANAAGRLAEPYPKASLFLARGAVVHEAGGTPAWELAFAAAAALAYSKALVRAGLSLPAAFGGIVLGLSVDADAVGSIAKLRAARVLWSRMTTACGSSSPARIEVRSSDRMLTRADPWTNLVRLTSAGFAGAVGGADTLALANFTDALGLPSPLARRLARNTQLILMEEAHLGTVSDPAAGAWALETQTDDLARAAWRHFTAIEAAGGLVEALRSGLIARKIGQARADLESAVRAKTIRILGVTDFPDSRPTAPEIETALASSAAGHDPRLPGPDSHCPPLTPVRLEELAA
jgi:methylmalonyl-CoA mutase